MNSLPFLEVLLVFARQRTTRMVDDPFRIISFFVRGVGGGISGSFAASFGHFEREHFHDGLLGTNVFGVRAMHTYVSRLLGLSKTSPLACITRCLLVALFSPFSAAVSISCACCWCMVGDVVFRYFSFLLAKIHLAAYTGLFMEGEDGLRTWTCSRSDHSSVASIHIALVCFFREWKD